MRAPRAPPKVDSRPGFRYSNPPMLGIALGAASFLVVFWVDAVSLKNLRRAKPVLWILGGILFVAGLVLAARDPSPIAFPAGLAAAGWALGGMFFLLLVYSLFIEIPFVSAYVREGAPPAVVSRGTYALCRHPGVLWLAGFLASLLLATGSHALFIAVPLWVGLDALWVALQEKLYFVRMFGGAYESYQRTVPMLVPTPRSIRECVRTVFRRKRK